MDSNRQEIIEKSLNFVANKGWTEHGGKFLDLLAKFLGELFNIDYVLIDKYSKNNPKIAETLAVFNRGSFLPNMVYELIHTPCENVIGCKLCSYETNIQNIFPKDELLVQMNVDSYIGIPLWSSKGEPIGLIAIMDNKPLPDVKTIELTLQIVAIKTAHELEKMLYENELEIKNTKLLEASFDLQQKYNELILTEEKLRVSNEELIVTSEALKESNEELLKAKKKAEESDRLKTEFLNNMSHEIRTPMNGILGFSKLLDKPNKSDEKRKNYINIIQNSGNQLMRIIDDILEISKLGTKQVKISENEICLNDLLLEYFSIFDIKAKENKIPLYLNKGLSDNQSRILTDETKLNKILSNLLENALKFTVKGYIEFGYKLKEDCEPTELEIYVKDTGIGINANKHEAVFERFSQEEKELSKNVGGLGLGLSIAKENAKLLGGKISLQSEKGKGSTFFVTIPYKAAISDVEKSSLNNMKEKKEQDKYTILIVEDEEVNYLFIETLLEDELEINCNVLHAKHGKEAVEMCQENQDVDFVLMDLKMPIMNGFEATSLIKEFRPNLPIVAQTAYTADQDKKKAVSVGFDDFISKPISEETLNEIMNKYLITK